MVAVNRSAAEARSLAGYERTRTYGPDGPGGMTMMAAEAGNPETRSEDTIHNSARQLVPGRVGRNYVWCPRITPNSELRIVTPNCVLRSLHRRSDMQVRPPSILRGSVRSNST